VSANGKRPAGGATRLIRDLDHLTDNFAGVSALRRAIFEIAVTGELTAGTLQSAWRRVPLADFGEFSGGSTPSKARGAFWGGDVPWISPKDMKTPEIGDTEDKVTRLALSEGRLRLLPTGSVVLVVRSGILRRTVPVAVTTVSATLNQDMKGLIPRADIDPRFVRLLFRGCERTILEAYVKGGTTVQSIKWDQLLTLELPLPPLAEQKRIVAKVDQLMALCDDLEAKQTKKRDLATQSTRSALTALTTAETADELRRAWERICGDLTLLFGDVASLTDLRRTILGLACRGLLTTHVGSSDGRAALDAVESRRRAWIAHHDVRDDSEASRLAKRLEQAEPQSPSTIIPSSWTWASLLRSCWRVVDCHNKTAPYQTAGIPLVRTTNIRDGRVLLGNTRFVSKETYEFWSRRCRPEQGDVLFTREAPMGECGLVPPAAMLCMGQRMMLLRTFTELVDPRYLLVALREPAFQERMSRVALGSTVKHLRVGDVENLMIPIPPIEEQWQIIAKVETLMALVDDLEAKLRKQEETATRLAESLAAAVAA
jgi:type I restriction enzyme S subunit